MATRCLGIATGIGSRFAPFLLLVLFAAAPCRALEAGSHGPGVLSQVSTIDALLAGVYDGQVDFAALKGWGDFGLGTFDALDGEMIALDGVFRQVLVDGSVRLAPDAARTPFAEVVFFRPETRMGVGAASMEELCARLLAGLPDKNLYYAIRVAGRFERIKARSVPPQKKPYPPLDQAAKSQAVFEFRDIEGDLVGFYSPAFSAKLGTPGFHMHFLSADKTRGGHVLDLAGKELQADIQTLAELRVVLPVGEAARAVDYSKDRSQTLKQVEQ